MNNRKSLSIIIAGGSGHWAELNHYPAILDLKKQLSNIKVAAIIDMMDPKTQTEYKNLQKILEIDNPEWINPHSYTEPQLENKLNDIAKKNNVRIIMVSTNPLAHFFYNSWGAKNNINVLCDKPLVISENASSNLKNAFKIQQKYEQLRNSIQINKGKNKRYLFCLPLRRRMLKPFVKTANELNNIYKSTGEGIRYMNVIINGGVHKYPIEFLKGGAHGYLDGIGSLSHSSYHYIDVVAWYLAIAKGNIHKLSISLPYIFRVRDYLKIYGYKKLRDLIEDSESFGFNDSQKIPEQILNAELDFTFHIKLLDHDDNVLGLVSYTSDHTTHTPRQTKYHPNMIEYTNDKLGGRMSQIYFDIHQGALQNIQIIKNDVVFSGNKIQTITRQHPKIGKLLTMRHYRDAYDSNTATPKDLVKAFIKYTAGYKIDEDYLNMICNFDDQRLTNKLFSLFYELIAQEYESHRSKLAKKKVDNEVIIDQFI